MGRFIMALHFQEIFSDKNDIMGNVVNQGGHFPFWFYGAEIRIEWSYFGHGYMQEKILAAGWCLRTYPRAYVGQCFDGCSGDAAREARSQVSSGNIADYRFWQGGQNNADKG